MSKGYTDKEVRDLIKASVDSAVCMTKEACKREYEREAVFKFGEFDKVAEAGDTFPKDYFESIIRTVRNSKKWESVMHIKYDAKSGEEIITIQVHIKE